MSVPPGSDDRVPPGARAILGSRLRELWRKPGIRATLLIFLGIRIVLLLFAPLARRLGPPAFLPDPVLRPYVGVSVESNAWLEPWQRWDTLHYQAIAERGYRAFDSALFAPPLYPLLIRWVSPLFAGNSLLAGILLSNLCFLAALFFLYRLAAAEVGDPAARRTVLYLASFPTAFFFMAAYSEALLLLATLGAVEQLRRGRWIPAGAWAALAPLARFQGAVVPILLALEALRRWRQGPQPDWKAALGLLLSGLGLAAFPAYLWLFLGRLPWEPFLVLEARFRGSFTWPGKALVRSIELLLQGDYLPSDYFDLAFTLLFLMLLIPILRRLPRIYGMYSVLLLIVVLSKFSDFQALLGASRHLLVNFPAFMVLAQFGGNRWVHRAILYLSWFGLLYLSGQFFIWGWVA